MSVKDNKPEEEMNISDRDYYGSLGCNSTIILQIILIYLKASEKIDVNWIIVFSPLIVVVVWAFLMSLFSKD